MKMMIPGKRVEEKKLPFYVLEKDGKFFYSIKCAQDKKIEFGPFDEANVWTEGSYHRIEKLKLEYDFLSDWNIVRVDSIVTSEYKFSYE